MILSVTAVTTRVRGNNWTVLCRVFYHHSKHGNHIAQKACIHWDTPWHQRWCSWQQQRKQSVHYKWSSYIYVS